MADASKIAAVLDAMADYVEEIESAKAASAQDERNRRVDQIAAKHAAVHGEELPEEARRKLASADAGSLDLIEGLLAKQGGTVDPLGAGAAPDRDDQPKTVKEAADAAGDRLVNWCIST